MRPGHLPNWTFMAHKRFTRTHCLAFLHIKDPDRAVRRACGKLTAIKIELCVVLRG